MAKKGVIKKFVKKNQEVTKYDFAICPNCGAEEVGKYCPNCGQSNKDFNKPIKEVFSELLDSINLDVRLLNTLIPFFTKPGFLAQEYFKGKRMKYVPPIRMYMFVSIIFFFLAQYADLNDFKNIGNVTNSAASDSIKKEFASAINTGDTSLTAFNNLIQNGSDSINDIIDIKKTKTGFFDGIKILETDSTNKSLEALSTEERNDLRTSIESDSLISEGVKKTIIGGLNISEKANLFWEKFLKNISYVLFILMPFFALILMITLIKSKKLYVHHLIFSINFHSFVFGLLSIVILLGKIPFLNSFELPSYILWGIPLYLMFGIKRFYRRSYIRSFFKTLGITLMYLFVIFVSIIIILATTAQGFYEA